jgi:hypothetical protein
MEEILIDEAGLGEARERYEPQLYIAATDSVVKWRNKKIRRQGEDTGKKWRRKATFLS